MIPATYPTRLNGTTREMIVGKVTSPVAAERWSTWIPIKVNASAGAENTYGTPKKQNLLTYSEEFDNAAWTKGNLSAFGSGSVANSIADPFGVVTADKILESSATGVSHSIMQGITKEASALVYTASVFVKPNNRDWVQLALYDGASVGTRVWFNVTTGEVGTTAAIGAGFTAVRARISAAKNGFYRCSLTATSNTQTTLQFFIYTASADNTLSFDGDVTKGLYLACAQVEQEGLPGVYYTTGSANLNIAANMGGISIFQLSPLTGKQAWVDYVPVSAVVDADTNAWNTSTAGFIPVYGTYS